MSGDLVVDYDTVSDVAAQVGTGATEVSDLRTSLQVTGLGTELRESLSEYLELWPTEVERASQALKSYAGKLEFAAEQFGTTDRDLAGGPV